MALSRPRQGFEFPMGYTISHLLSRWEFLFFSLMRHVKDKNLAGIDNRIPPIGMTRRQIVLVLPWDITLRFAIVLF
jgi:hypothetical protein